MTKKEERKLEHIREVKCFGEDIGLTFKRLFSRYDNTTKDLSMHVMVATKPNKVSKFSQKEKTAKGFGKLAVYERRYRRMGLDTLLSAFIGWDGSDITRGLINSPYVELTGIVLHEGWHKTTGLKNVVCNLSLDECISAVIENIGAIEYSKIHRKQDVAKAEMIYNETKVWVDYILKYNSLLKESYCHPDWRDNKKVLLAEATKEKNVLKSSMNSSIKALFANKEDINNAYFYYYYTYCQYYHEVDCLMRELGLEESVRFLRRYKSADNCLRGMRKVIDA